MAEPSPDTEQNPADAPADTTDEAQTEAASPEVTAAPKPVSAETAPAPEAPPAESPAPVAEEKPVEVPEVLQDCVAKIRETIQNDLDDRELVKALKKHVRQLKNWNEWSDHARNAYAHLLAAEIIHSKAAAICIDNGLNLDDASRAEYEHLLRAMQKRTPR